MHNSPKQSSRQDARTLLREQVVALHLCSLEQLAELHARRSLIGPVERATTSALFVFDQWCLGMRPAHYRQRAESLLQTCSTGYEILWREKFVSLDVYNDIRRRCEHIVKTLHQLPKVPLEEPIRVELQPVRPTPRRGESVLRPEHATAHLREEPTPGPEPPDRANGKAA